MGVDAEHRGLVVVADDPHKPAAGGAAKVTPRDVASATAVGTAFRVGARRQKAAVGTGAAAGAAAGAAGRKVADANRSSLWTALAVVAVCIGMLLLMIYKS